MLLLAAALGACGSVAPALPLASTVPPPSAAATPSPDLIQRGAFLFLDPGLSGDGTQSCASCHPGGGSDHRVYRNGLPVEPGSDGGRRTLRLSGVAQTAPYLWDGSAATLQAAIERMLKVEMRSGPIPPANLLALEAYVQTIRPFDRGRILPDGTPGALATLTTKRGFQVYQEAGCPECHPPPTYTQPGRFDVASDGRWNPPVLRGVAVSGPYGHDGRWSSLERVLTTPGHPPGVELSSEDLHRLLAYLRLL